MRAAPALDIIQALLSEQSSTIAYDPVASDQAKRLLPDVVLASSWQEAVKEADAVLILTDWAEFKSIDLEELKVLMRDSVVIDGRNLFHPEEMKQQGFYYDSVGRAQVDGRLSQKKEAPSPSLTAQTGTH